MLWHGEGNRGETLVAIEKNKAGEKDSDQPTATRLEQKVSVLRCQSDPEMKGAAGPSLKNPTSPRQLCRVILKQVLLGRCVTLQNGHDRSPMNQPKDTVILWHSLFPWEEFKGIYAPPGNRRECYIKPNRLLQCRCRGRTIVLPHKVYSNLF